jgi:hypothetical protein
VGADSLSRAAGSLSLSPRGRVFTHRGPISVVGATLHPHAVAHKEAIRKWRFRASDMGRRLTALGSGVPGCRR